MLFVCQLWGAYAKSFQSLRASVIVGGFAGGSTEALGAAIINVNRKSYLTRQKLQLI